MTLEVTEILKSGKHDYPICPCGLMKVLLGDALNHQVSHFIMTSKAGLPCIYLFRCCWREFTLMHQETGERLSSGFAYSWFYSVKDNWGDLIKEKGWTETTKIKQTQNRAKSQIRIRQNTKTNKYNEPQKHEW